ncbi:xanthine dehydrogenase family protein molybdopterin-binding subunit [Nibrella saemangeumensis]|uniref:Xanthine dehydrogenase family protein molybdopterin-binding subunit n=1 Tax=Nibrella saemangeumensis TaxID=1084526 RepID=A0ABP8NQ17_9BACT
MKKSSLAGAVSRRKFLKGAGCLTVAFSMTDTWAAVGEVVANDRLPDSLRRHPRVSAWLEVLADGRVRVFTGKTELGQGIRTAIAQVAAEELDLPMERVELVLADTGRTPDERYTAGSASIESSAMSVRYAAAAARQLLLERAAQKLGRPVAQLQLENGVVSTAGGKKLTLADILDGKQIEDEVRLPITLKPKHTYRLVRKEVPRSDIGRMVRGEQVHIHDLRLPGMVHARVIRPGSYQARLKKLDEAALRQAVPGILKTVVDGNFIGVIAADEYAAIKGQTYLYQHAEWSVPDTLPAGKSLAYHIKELPAKTERVAEKGIIPSGSGAVIKASYFKPYLMHGSIGPSCAIALFEGGNLQIWTHSQGVFPLRDALQKWLKLSAEQVHVTAVPGSGCYGHNGADDVAADAALLAMAYPGKPVRLQWSREEEHAWEPYGSAMLMELEAGLDNAGKISHWKLDLWSDTHSNRPGGDPSKLLPAWHRKEPLTLKTSGFSGGTARNSEPYYTIPNLQIDTHSIAGPLRVSALRSLGAYGNVFAIESFMDELAEKAEKDPMAFRLMHLSDQRAITVLTKLQELLAAQKVSSGEGIGISFARYKNTSAYCAVAAKVAVNAKEGSVQMQQLWAVVDAGEVINLDGLKNQIEGGMIQSASWTLKEEVQFDARHVTSRDWVSYPIVRFSDVPAVAVTVVDRPTEPPLGAGEAAQGPTAAAIVNAVYRACGKRVRHLPVRPDKVAG